MVGVKSGREGEKAKGGEGLSQKQRVWFGEYATAGKKALTTGSAIISIVCRSRRSQLPPDKKRMTWKQYGDGWEKEAHIN